jgi:hypothetical protein
MVPGFKNLICLLRRHNMNRKKEIFTGEAKRLYGITPYSVRNYSNFKDGSTSKVYEWFTESWSFDYKRKELIEISEVVLFIYLALVRKICEEPDGGEQDRDYIYFDLEGNPERDFFDDGKSIPKDFLKEIEENKEWLGKVGTGKTTERGTHFSYWS